MFDKRDQNMKYPHITQLLICRNDISPPPGVCLLPETPLHILTALFSRQNTILLVASLTHSIDRHPCYCVDLQDTCLDRVSCAGEDSGLQLGTCKKCCAKVHPHLHTLVLFVTHEQLPSSCVTYRKHHVEGHILDEVATRE